jgi:hypothetical protein
MGGESASKTAYCTYISHCDTIRTQTLNCSQTAAFTKMLNQPKTMGSVQLGCLIGQNRLPQFQFGSNPDLEPNGGF